MQLRPEHLSKMSNFARCSPLLLKPICCFNLLTFPYVTQHTAQKPSSPLIKLCSVYITWTPDDFTPGSTKRVPKASKWWKRTSDVIRTSADNSSAPRKTPDTADLLIAQYIPVCENLLFVLTNDNRQWSPLISRKYCHPKISLRPNSSMTNGNRDILH